MNSKKGVLVIFIFGITILGAYIFRNNLHPVVRPVLASVFSNKDQRLPQHLIFEETFEEHTYFKYIDDYDVGEWDYALQRVDSPVFEGTKSIRFEIRHDQSMVANGKRSEVSIVNGRKGDIEKEAWYSFAVYCPESGYAYDNNREIINQWYQSGSPATSLRTKRDRFILETGNTPESRQVLDIGAIRKNSWHQFVIHFIHSYDNDGLIELWFDHNKVIEHKGGNMYNGLLPKWKVGLYKAGFKFNTSDVKNRIIYFDNIRVGNEYADNNLMQPSR